MIAETCAGCGVLIPVVHFCGPDGRTWCRSCGPCPCNASPAGLAEQADAVAADLPRAPTVADVVFDAVYRLACRRDSTTLKARRHSELSAHHQVEAEL